jgi:fumarate reductase subunit D
MQKLKTAVFWTVLASETGHVFCCVMPTIVTILSLLSGLGLISFHEFMHDWEVPIIVASALILALGWALHFVSLKLDCHDTGCHHGACAPKKVSTSKLLWIATGLFAVNLTIYLTLHLTYA